MKLLLSSFFTLSMCAVGETGVASFYSVRSNGGTHTASGERLNDNTLTAAHKTLKFGTIVNVTNLNNKKSVQVRINNRGPFIKGRIIDLSKAAAKKINLEKSGIAKVRVEVVKPAIKKAVPVKENKPSVKQKIFNKIKEILKVIKLHWRKLIH